MPPPPRRPSSSALANSASASRAPASSSNAVGGTGSTGRHLAVAQVAGTLSEVRLKQLLTTNQAWRVVTVDGLNWIDPFTGTVVPAPFGLDEPALAWLRQNRPWLREGQAVEPKPLAELLYIRWVHWLKARLPDPEHVWLRQFLPDGRWLNPFTGVLISGIVRDNGRLTMDTVRQLAVVLRDCPQAQKGVPLGKDILAQRLRELAPAPRRSMSTPLASPLAAPPVAAPTPVSASSSASNSLPIATVPTTTARFRRGDRVDRAEASPSSAAPDSVSAGALEPVVNKPTTRISKRHAAQGAASKPGSDKITAPKTKAEKASADPFGTDSFAANESAAPKVAKSKSNQPPTEPSVRVVSGYRILGTLGMGGMSTVYRAVQLSMEREVALKVLDQQGPPDPGYTERFLREARAAGRINHPNVVTCFDVGVHHGNRLYMALELVTGGDATALADKHGGRLPERLALGVLRDTARGLGAIHAVGLIHRDIKSANLFIAADGSVKLGDLGLVRDTTAGATGKYRTLVGIAVGTPAFMSPEQSQGAKDLDIRSDVYALGASVYALLSGRPPYEADSMFDLAAMILNDPVPDIRHQRPELGPLTAAVLTKAMAKDRAARYQSPHELLAAAEDALAHLLMAERPGQVPGARTPLGSPVLTSSDSRGTRLPNGQDHLRAAAIRVAEVRGTGLIVTAALGSSVLCLVASPGLLPLAEATERIDARLRAYLTMLRSRPLGGFAQGLPDATPASLCRALLVDGLSAAVAQIELQPRSLTVACTPQARAVIACPKDAAVLTEVSASPAAIPFAPHSLLVLAAGLTGKPFNLWGTLVARCDQGADAVAAHLPLTSDGGTILVLGAEPQDQQPHKK